MMQNMTAGHVTMIIFYRKYLILEVRKIQSWTKLFDFHFFPFIKSNCWRGSFHKSHQYHVVY